MKRLFTLLVVLSIAVSGFAQVKISRSDVKYVKAEQVVLTGLEDLEAIAPTSTRSIVANPVETELYQTYYDWQTNTGPRNFTALWPDGYAVVATTVAVKGDFSDRGTGLSIFDPAIGEWTWTEGRVEPEKTGFGSIARYGERGLVVAAHTSSAVGIYINENFRDGGEWSEPIYVGAAQGGAWPAVVCSGENNNIIHVLYNIADATINGVLSPTLYARIVDGAVEVEDLQLELLNSDHATDLSSNTTHFMPWDAERPNHVSFILNNAWSDGKLVYSEDNGQTWSETVFFEHPNINYTFPTETIGYMYPRYVSAAYDGENNLHIAYEYNGTNGAPGEGGYYPGLGGIGYWSEILPKNPLCVGGIGEVGAPFIMDTAYLWNDIYASSWIWSNATHEPLPEYIGQLEYVDEYGNVINDDNWDGVSPTYFPSSQEMWGEHGKYNSGTHGFPTMVYDKDSDVICVVWSQICGSDESGIFFNGTYFFYRLFCNVSTDGGLTWKGTKGVLTDFMNIYDEMVYPVAVPYIYQDEAGKYIQVVYQNDQDPGPYVQDDESDPENNYMRAVRIDLDYMCPGIGVDEINANPVQMSVYPNPATSGEVKIQVNSEAEVSVFNTVGQLIDSFVVDGIKSINVNNYASGVYFIKADNGSNVTTQKFVVE